MDGPGVGAVYNLQPSMAMVGVTLIDFLKRENGKKTQKTTLFNEDSIGVWCLTLHPPIPLKAESPVFASRCVKPFVRTGLMVCS